jgi:hypothetical protein
MAQTSDRISSMAARYRTMTGMDVVEAGLDPRKADALAKDIRSMAASLQRQDETPGTRLLKMIGLGPKSA